MSVTSRINRVLVILSHVSQNQGIPLEELAQKVDMRPRQLVKELEFISLIGKPPFKPDDYIDIYMENNRVFIEFDQSMNRPLRFTRPEAVALLMSLELLDPELDPEGVRSLQDKIGAAISESVDSKAPLQDKIVMERPSNLISDHFRQIRSAVDHQRKIRIEYYSLTRNRTSDRVIRPYYLMNRIGYWYLTGYCEKREDLRTFKFERILSVELLSENFETPRDFDVQKYRSEFLKSMGERKIEILFDREVAPWIKEHWGSAAEETDEGQIVLVLYSETWEFPSRLVLGSAPHARPLSPPEFVEQVREDAQQIMQMQAEEVSG